MFKFHTIYMYKKRSFGNIVKNVNQLATFKLLKSIIIIIEIIELFIDKLLIKPKKYTVVIVKKLSAYNLGKSDNVSTSLFIYHNYCVT